MCGCRKPYRNASMLDHVRTTRMRVTHGKITLGWQLIRGICKVRVRCLMQRGRCICNFQYPGSCGTVSKRWYSFRIRYESRLQRKDDVVLRVIPRMGESERTALLNLIRAQGDTADSVLPVEDSDGTFKSELWFLFRTTIPVMAGARKSTHNHLLTLSISNSIHAAELNTDGYCRHHWSPGT